MEVRACWPGRAAPSYRVEQDPVLLVLLRVQHVVTGREGARNGGEAFRKTGPKGRGGWEMRFNASRRSRGRLPLPCSDEAGPFPTLRPLTIPGRSGSPRSPARRPLPTPWQPRRAASGATAHAPATTTQAHSRLGGVSGAASSTADREGRDSPEAERLRRKRGKRDLRGDVTRTVMFSAR